MDGIKKYQLGAGLVESMVSLLIMGVGLLGVLTMQSNGLNSHQRAVFVTEAQLVAQDMADRIMAYGSTESNATSNAVADDGFYNGIDIKKSSAEVSESTCSTESPCSSAESIKTYDTNAWLRVLSDTSLPRGRATVEWADQVYAISVMWDQDREGGEGDVECNSNNCFTMEVRLP